MKKNIISISALTLFLGFIVYATIETIPVDQESLGYSFELPQDSPIVVSDSGLKDQDGGIQSQIDTIGNKSTSKIEIIDSQNVPVEVEPTIRVSNLNDDFYQDDEEYREDTHKREDDDSYEDGD